MHCLSAQLSKLTWLHLDPYSMSLVLDLTTIRDQCSYCRYLRYVEVPP